MPKGYTTKADLAKYLGRVFDADQDAIADLAIGAAEIIIDRKTSIRYKEGAAQTLTIYKPPSPRVQLPGVGPFSTITVQGVSEFGGTAVALISGLQYEVRDLANGVLWFPYYGDYYSLIITYTPTNAVPDNIKLATNVMAAHWMRPILNDEVPGLANYSVGGEFNIAFSRYVQEQGYPAEVDSLLGIPSFKIA